MAYDLAGRLISITDPQGNVTTRAYDDNGRLILVTDATGKQTTMAYDPEGHMVTQTTPDGTTTSFNYDERGRRTQFTAQDGGVTRLNFGSLTLQSTTDELGRSTQYAFTSLMRPTSVTDANNNTFTYVWTPDRKSVV